LQEVSEAVDIAVAQAHDLASFLVAVAEAFHLADQPHDVVQAPRDRAWQGAVEAPAFFDLVESVESVESVEWVDRVGHGLLASASRARCSGVRWQSGFE
jgi:hypothetical protein